MWFKSTMYRVYYNGYYPWFLIMSCHFHNKLCWASDQQFNCNTSKLLILKRLTIWTQAFAGYIFCKLKSILYSHITAIDCEWWSTFAHRLDTRICKIIYEPRRDVAFFARSQCELHVNLCIYICVYIGKNLFKTIVFSRHNISAKRRQ